MSAPLALRYDRELRCFDLAVEDGRLATDAGLGSTVAASLFTDARVDEAEAAAQQIEDRRGYWAGAYSPGVIWGSAIWALARAGVTVETARRVEGRARAALAWMLRAGIAASIHAEATAVTSATGPRIELRVRIQRPAQPASPYQPLWEETYVL